MKFIEKNKSIGEENWSRLSQETSWKSWSGNAFETICLKHIVPIKKALGIGAVYTESSVWRYAGKKNEQGAQIDLLIDRRDHCINICEIKFSQADLELTKAYAKELDNKINVFRRQTNTRKALFMTLITTYGVKNTTSFPGAVQAQVTMDALFV